MVGKLCQCVWDAVLLFVWTCYSILALVLKIVWIYLVQLMSIMYLKYPFRPGKEVLDIEVVTLAVCHHIKAMQSVVTRSALPLLSHPCRIFGKHWRGVIQLRSHEWATCKSTSLHREAILVVNYIL